MSQSIETKINANEYLEKIEEEIISHNKIIENLVWQRSELLTKKEDLELCELVDCIFENGLTASEALDIIVTALEKKKT
jgi:hypothetical protein